MFTRPMLAYDGSPLAERALETAIEIAKKFDVPLGVVTVQEPLPPYLDPNGYGVPEPSSDYLQVEAVRENYYKGILESAVKQISAAGVKPEPHLILDREIEGIIGVVNEGCYDLLILGLPHHSGFLGRLWGSTVRTLADRTDVSVLGVR